MNYSNSKQKHKDSRDKFLLWLVLSFLMGLAIIQSGCQTVRAASTGANNTVQALANDTEAIMKAIVRD